jgi:Uma2 family endonuclease
MAMQTAFRSEERFTQAQFCEWLREYGRLAPGRYELIGGRIVMTPPAGFPHSNVIVALVSILHRHVAELGLGQVLESSAGYELPSGDTLAPDASFISNARLAAGAPPERGKFFGIVPDLAIEVLSDSTAKRDRTEKKELYALNGVDEYWLVDTDAHEVTVLCRDGKALMTRESVRRGHVPSRVLPDLELSIEDVFRGLP